MSENLSNFLVDLASDFDRVARFMSDPAGELAESPLTPAERAIVMSGDGQLEDALRPVKTTGSLAGGGGKPGKKSGAKKKPAKKKTPAHK